MVMTSPYGAHHGTGNWRGGTLSLVIESQKRLQQRPTVGISSIEWPPVKENHRGSDQPGGVEALGDAEC